MAIIKRSNGSYQVKYRGTDGVWISRTFFTKKEAESFDLKLKQEKRTGGFITNQGRSMSLNEFFELWIDTLKGQASSGWLKTRRQQYRDFIQPILGAKRLQAINPPDVASVLTAMVEKRAPQTRLHVFGLLHKLFRDAEESFRLVTFNPVLRTYKPQVPSKEAPHLNLEQIRKLLVHVRGKPYGDAIWLQFYLGLRVGELQALRWGDVDLSSGIVVIRRTYIRKERVFRDYPKGRKQHWKPIPPEAKDVFEALHLSKSPADFVVRSDGFSMLSYEWYQRTLVRYCKQLRLPRIGTHGLRHSTSGLYLSNGASRDQIRALMAHSSERVTERYVHHHDSRLGELAEVIRLFPSKSELECSQNVPKDRNEAAAAEEAVP